MKKSPQAIEDYYINKGLSGKKLQQALQRDREYQIILFERKNRLTKKFKIPKKDRERYVLSTDQDYKILKTIYQLEKESLSVIDRQIVALIRTQLEHDWRKALLKTLKSITRKYN
jgi:hypothetical protein